MHMPRFVRLAAVAATSLVVAQAVSVGLAGAGPPSVGQLTGTLQPSSSAYLFGGAVANWQGETIVGADESGPSYEGKAFIYTKTGTTWHTTEIDDPLAVPDDEFGSAVAIFRSTAIIGAIGVNGNDGAAFVYTDTGGTWTESQELTASDAAPLDNFGASISMTATEALIGSFNSPTYGQSGAAYVFSNSGGIWSQTGELDPTSRVVNDLFSWTVAVSGNWAVVGAWATNSYTGAAYVFKHGIHGWVQTQILTVPAAPANLYFGSSVAIALNQVMIGAPGPDSAAGSTYVFARTGTVWSPSAVLTEAVGSPEDFYGSAVAMSGHEAVVTAPGYAAYTGTAYLYDDTGGSWVQQAQLSVPTLASGSLFGVSASIAGLKVAVGAQIANEAFEFQA